MRYQFSLGIYSLFPYYYLAAVKPQHHCLKFLWQKKILFADVIHIPRAYRLMSIPQDYCELSTVNHPPTRGEHGFYLGQHHGQAQWLIVSEDNAQVHEYLAQQGPLTKGINCFEVDVFALWAYAYWLLFDIQGFSQAILWIYEHQYGQYFLLGQNENLWNFGTDIATCLQGWPAPQRVVSFNQSLTCTIENVEHLAHEHFAWVMARALAIRGGYDLF